MEVPVINTHPVTNPHRAGAQVLGVALIVLLAVGAWPSGLAARVSFK